MPRTLFDLMQEEQPGQKPAATTQTPAPNPFLQPQQPTRNPFAPSTSSAGQVFADVGQQIEQAKGPNPTPFLDTIKQIPEMAANMGAFTGGNIAGQAGATYLGLPPLAAKGVGALTGATTGATSDWLSDHLSSWFKGKVPDEQIPSFVDDFQKNLANAGISFGVEGVAPAVKEMAGYAKGDIPTAPTESWTMNKLTGRSAFKEGALEAKGEALKIRDAAIADETGKQTQERTALQHKVGDVQEEAQGLKQDTDTAEAQKQAKDIQKLEEQHTKPVKQAEFLQKAQPDVSAISIAKKEPLVRKPITDANGKPVLDDQGNPRFAAVSGAGPIQLRRSMKEIVHDAAQPQKDYYHGEYERQLKGKEDVRVPTMELNGEPDRIREQLITEGQTKPLSGKVNQIFARVGSELTAQPSKVKVTPEMVAEVERELSLAPGESQDPRYRDLFQETMAERTRLPEMSAPISTLFGLRSEAQTALRGNLEPHDRRALAMLTEKIHATLDPYLPPNSTLSGEYKEFMDQFGPKVQYGKHFEETNQTGPVGEMFFDHKQSSIQRVNMLFDNAKSSDRPAINGIASEYLVKHVDDFQKNPDFYANVLEKMYGSGHELADPNHFLHNEQRVDALSNLLGSQTPAGNALRTKFSEVEAETKEHYGKEYLKQIQPIVKQLEPYFQKELKAKMARGKTTAEKVDAVQTFLGLPTLKETADQLFQYYNPDPVVAGQEALAKKFPAVRIEKREGGIPIEQQKTGEIPAATNVKDVMQRSVMLGLTKKAERSWMGAYTERILPITIGMGATDLVLGGSLSTWHAGMLAAGGAAKAINPLRAWQARALQDPASAKAFVHAMDNFSKPKVLDSIARMSVSSGIANVIQTYNAANNPPPVPQIQSPGPFVPDTPSKNRRSSAETHSEDLVAKGFTDVSKSLAKNLITQDDLKGMLENAA